VSVAQNTTLPGQPPAGSVFQSPLGGSGVTAPHLETLVEAVLIGDVSGGTSTQTIFLDPRYSSMISYVNVFKAATTAFDALFEIFRSDVTDIRHSANLVSNTISPNCYIWSPPAVIVSGIPGQAVPFVRVTTPNTDGVNTTVSVQIFQFVKNVREITPLPILLMSAPRSATSRG